MSVLLISEFIEYDDPQAGSLRKHIVKRNDSWPYAT